MTRRFLRLLILVTLPGVLLTAAFAQPVPDETDLDLDGVPGVAAPPENPQPVAPSILVGTGSILIDRSHGNAFNVSGFMNFLVARGWVIDEHLTGPITASVLTGYDILLIPTRSAFTTMTAFSAPEVIAIQSFLGGGRGLWVLSDSVDPIPINTLSTAFGVTFQYDYLQDPTTNEGELFWPTIYVLSSHPVTAGVESYGYYLGDCLAVSAPAQVTGRADDDAFSSYCPAGSRPPTIAVWENGGRAVFAGDITTLSPQWFPNLLEPEEQLLLQNIVNWLLGPPPNATSRSSWGRVKARDWRSDR